VAGHRRDHWGIVGGLLEAIETGRRGEIRMNVSPTHLSIQVGLSYDRSVSYLYDLERAGLLEFDVIGARLTEKGEQFLADYRAWSRALESYGLQSPGRL